MPADFLKIKSRNQRVKYKLFVTLIIESLFLTLLFSNSIKAASTISNINLSELTYDHDIYETIIYKNDFLHDRNKNLIAFGVELKKSAIENKTSYITKNAVSLPAAPASFIMVLIGLSFISLVKNRSIWINAVAASFSSANNVAGSVVPYLTNLLSVRINNNVHLFKKPKRFYNEKNYTRLRAEIDGTSFITLLKSLEGIPENKYASTSCLPKPPLEKNISSIFHLSTDITHYLKSYSNEHLAYILKRLRCFIHGYYFFILSRRPPPIKIINRTLGLTF